MRYDLTTIGEGQIRLTCERGDRLATARSLRMTAAGSEANVAGLLSELGRATAWTTKLPRGELADRIALEYSAVGVDMSHVVMTDEGRVALDVNFRSLLWDGEQARTVLEPIARGASILFCSRTDAGIVFGIPGQGVDVCRALREEIGAPRSCPPTDAPAPTCPPPPGASASTRSSPSRSSTGPVPVTPSWRARFTAGSTATSGAASRWAPRWPSSP